MHAKEAEGGNGQPSLAEKNGEKRRPCDCSAQLQGVPGPPGPKCRKSPKKVAQGLSAQSAKKCRKSRKVTKKCQRETFSALFWHSGPTGPGRPFWDLYGILGPEGPALPVTGRCNRKARLQENPAEASKNPSKQQISSGSLWSMTNLTGRPGDRTMGMNGGSALRIWGFRGPGFRSARQVLCGDAPRLFLDHFSKHLSI